MCTFLLWEDVTYSSLLTSTVLFLHLLMSVLLSSLLFIWTFKPSLDNFINQLEKLIHKGKLPKTFFSKTVWEKHRTQSYIYIVINSHPACAWSLTLWQRYLLVHWFIHYLKVCRQVVEWESGSCQHKYSFTFVKHCISFNGSF